MSEAKKISLGIIMSVINLAVTIFISLFITPYIVNRLGKEAYGFVGLANNFVSYAALVTIALNSMASRFVSVEIYKKNYTEANRYFTSVFYANVLTAVVMAPILAFLVFSLQSFLEIPVSLVTDVKVTFLIVFVQFLTNMLLSRFEIATFVTNRLYLSQRNSIISSLLRLGVILGCFALFDTRITYLAVGGFAGAVFIYIMNLYYTRTFLPELRVKREYFSFGHIKELLAAGVWNLVNKLSAILLDGLDLLLTNVFIGAAEMGALALSKTIPAMFLSLRGTLDYPFTPPMTKCYAEGDIAGVVKYARTGNKVLGIFMIAPMAVFLIYGQDFFKLWVPKEDSWMIQILALLSIVSLLAGACINSVFTVFTITNRLKLNSLVILGTGIATVLTNFLLLEITNWGVYIIAGVSSVYSLLRNYIFTPLYGAHCLGVKKSTFYHEIVTGNVCLVLNAGVGIAVRHFVVGSSWLTLIFGCAVAGVICLAINLFIVLNKNERAFALAYAKNKLKRGKE